MKRQLIYHTQIAVKETKRVNDHVMIYTQNATPLNTSLTRISRDGIAITCGRQTIEELLPNHYQVAPKQPVSLSAHFKIYEEIQTSCQVFSVRRLAKDTFQIDMKFCELTTREEELIDQYMAHSLQKQNVTHKFKEVA